MIYYFILQYKLLYRSLKNYSESPAALLLVLLPAFVFLSIAFLKNVQYAPYLFLLIETAILLSLSTKSRNLFLAAIFIKQKYILLRITENLLVGLLFVSLLFYTGQFKVAFICIAVCLLLSFFNSLGSGFKLTLPSPFSKRPYEFSIGFRKMYWLFIVIYSSTFYFLVYNNFLFSLAGVLGLYITCILFYSHFEPVFYVWIYSGHAVSFLKKKLTTAIYYSSILCLPILLALVVLHPEKIVLILLVLIVGISYLLLSILYKYVNFPVNTTQSHNIQYFAGLICPPLLFLIIPNFYFQAVRRLKDYLLC